MSTAVQPLRQRITGSVIALRRWQKQAEQRAAWLEREADELQATGDCDMWNLAAAYRREAAELRGME